MLQITASLTPSSARAAVNQLAALTIGAWIAVADDRRASFRYPLCSQFVHAKHNVINWRLLRPPLADESSSGLPEDALDHADGNPIDLGDLGYRHSVFHPGSDARVVRLRDITRGPGLGVGWCCNFFVADRCR